MLRVGLTGELGSGKSTVARLLAERGAIVLSSDDMAREMMQPGEPVYGAILDHFGPGVLLPDGHLDRTELARLAFSPTRPRVEELNAIIHPPVLAEQERQLAEIAHTQPNAIVVIESALVLTTKHAGDEPWRKRFDRILLVTAPDEVKLDRVVGRARGDPGLAGGIREDALRRLSAQRIPPATSLECLVIANSGDRQALAHRTEEVWLELRQQADNLRVRGARL